jgi:hypothetical protein
MNKMDRVPLGTPRGSGGDVTPNYINLPRKFL